jgi:hypothetical protein
MSENTTDQTEQLIDGKAGTLKYIAETPDEPYGGLAAQTKAAAKWALDEIERLQAENARLKADIARRDSDLARLDMGKAFGPTIELLESVRRRVELTTQWTENGYGELYQRAEREIARLRAITAGDRQPPDSERGRH